MAHGLLAGRPAEPYVDWCYGACLGAGALALLIRLVATARNRPEVAPEPVTGPGPLPGFLYGPSAGARYAPAAALMAADMWPEGMSPDVRPEGWAPDTRRKGIRPSADPR